MLSLQKSKTNINLVQNAVINLSSKGLSQDETNVLARGFKFRPTLKELPIREIIIATETLIKTASIPPPTAAHLRNTTLTEIEKMKDREKRKPTKMNLSSREWKAIKKIADDKERIVIPADKGDKSVVMDYGMDAMEQKEEDLAILDGVTYLSKLQDRIEPHIKLDHDPTAQHEKKLNAALRKMKQMGN
jgi:hypothetical protein